MPRFCLLPLETTPRDPGANFRRLQTLLADCLPRERPDLVCLPECTLTGYLFTEEDFARFAEPVPGASTRRMAELAAQWGVFLCFGLLERTAEGVYNTALLLNPAGEIVLKYRKINEKPPFQPVRIANPHDERNTIPFYEAPWGRVSILICGDLFSEAVVRQLPAGLDYLLVPMSRAFDGVSPDPARWAREERAAYLEAARRTGAAATLIVNARETGIPEPAFGGALAVTAGEVAESPHGTSEPLIWG